MKRAVIYFRDGSVDWVDPINDEGKDVVYGEKIVTIDNGYHKYEFKRATIKTIAITVVDHSNYKDAK